MRKILSISMGLFFIWSLLVGPSISFAQEKEVGMEFSGKCLNGMGTNCFRYETVIGIDSAQQQRYTAESIAQDVILSATYMVGTILTLVIIWCGMGFIIASKGGGDVNSYKKGLQNAAIGAVLVRGAYAIVRLIQYIAK